MNLIGFTWSALMAMHAQRSCQIAWFVYGWIEREQVLNAIACADGWTRSTGSTAARLQPSGQGIKKTVSPVASRASVHGSDRAESARCRSPEPVRPRS
jgi:hypothetical protein